MSIRAKLIAFFLSGILLALVSIGSLAAWEFNSYAEHAFQKEAILELRRIDAVLSQYVDSGLRTAQRLAANPLLQGGSGQYAKYTETKTPTVLLYADHNPYEQKIYNLFMDAKNLDKSFGLIFMGAVDGGFVQAPEKDELGPGYDPRKRPWYKDALAAKDALNVSKVYMSSNKSLVTSITSKIFAANSSLAGILAIDLDLAFLSNYINTLKIGKSGYAMIFDKDGTILADPKHPTNFFKPLQDANLPLLTPVLKMKQGFLTGKIDNVEKNIAVYSSESLGWKIAVIIDTSEVHEVANGMIIYISLIGLGICIAFVALTMLVARSITRPIEMLVQAAGAIAGGDFHSLPDSRFFSGEMQTLHGSLNRMVTELGTLVETSKTKTLEAEEQTHKATQALADADAARLAAESAKRGGMLHAAEQLEGIVSQTRKMADALTTYINTAVTGAARQSKHAGETFTAMDEMNSSVTEVAHNAAQTATNADGARIKAETGASMVAAVKHAVTDVDTRTSQLKTAIGTLGEHAHGIGQIMTVITDIADQTNLLALNAAIEAARAGDAGRGFAVVADEVRKLAEKTMTATKEVGDAVQAIQNGTETSAHGMEDATKAVQRSTELAVEAETALREIVSISQDTASQINSIAAASERQASTSDQIATGAEEMNRIAQETANVMHDAQQAVNALVDLSQALEKVISGLKNS